MLRIALVEDEPQEAALLEGLLNEYAQTHSMEIAVEKYNDSRRFLAAFDDLFDLVFLDICMPGFTGMDVAHKLREKNSDVCIVFVTNMLQYAVEGYSVQASDFIVKPASQPAVARVMRRMQEQILRRGRKTIILRDSTSGRSATVRLSDILYVEVSRHRLTWHTRQGDFADWGSLDSAEEKVPAGLFSRCHVSYLVQLGAVEETRKDSVTVGGTELPISRSHKGKFFSDLAVYLGEVR